MLTPSHWFLAWLILRTWIWRHYIAPKRRLIFDLLQGIISQKKKRFLSTVVRTSDPKNERLSLILILSYPLSSARYFAARGNMDSSAMYVRQTYQHKPDKCSSEVGGAPALYTVGCGFKSRVNGRLSWSMFSSGFLDIPTLTLKKKYLNLGHNVFLPHPFRFIIHYHSIIRRYLILATGSVVK
jgi:hypothetical protein